MDTETESEPVSHGPFSWAQQTTEPIEEEITPQPDEGLSLILDEGLQPVVVAAKVFYGIKHVEQGSDMYLHVNVKGVAMISPQLSVHSFIKYNMIASWAVDGDVFRIQVVERKSNGAKVQAFVTGFEKAVALKNQLWTYVNLYLQNPATVQQLQAQLPPIAQGEPAPPGLLAGCPPFGTGTFMNVHLSGVNPIAELKRILSTAESSMLADSISKAVLKGGPEYARAIGEKLASAVLEVRTARDALQAVLGERDALRAQLADAIKLAAQATNTKDAGGTQNMEAARAAEEAARKAEGELRALRGHVGELEAEVATWRAANSNQQRLGDSYAQLAGEYTHLETDNARLIAMLEENQGLLEGQMRLAKDMEAQLLAERAARQEAEALLEAAAEQARRAASSQHLARGKKVHAALAAALGGMRELQKQCCAVRADVESLKTAVPLIGTYFEKQLQEYLASGGFASLQDAVGRYKRECRLRKALYNQLMELRGNIRVYCRVRPPSAQEEATAGGSESIVRFPADCSDTLSVIGDLATKTFEFDRVFPPSSSQAGVFEDTCPLVQSVMDGFNVCIFAYGQTGSGKTHTMEGPVQDPGVNSRAVQELFRLRGERGGEWEVTITVSILEIYNEAIRDLLLPDGGGGKLEVRQHPQGGVHIPGLTHREVQCPADLEAIWALARRHRTTFATNMNLHSSRSHSLCSASVMCTNRLTGVTTRGKLHLVDLAGSERVSRSEAEGERLKEAQAINRSLAALGDVINALATKSPHVPFRNSKLTYALQDSLGGDSKVLMFVQVSPSADSAAETLCSLNFATRVRGVELGPARSSRTTDAPSSPSPSARGDSSTPPPSRSRAADPASPSSGPSPSRSDSFGRAGAAAAGGGQLPGSPSGSRLLRSISSGKAAAEAGGGGGASSQQGGGLWSPAGRKRA